MTRREEHLARFQDAARELERQGQRATLRAVRRAVGSGSMTDITLALQLYRERAIPKSTSVDGMPEPMLAAVRDLYQRAQEEAMTVIAAERAALAEAQQALVGFRLEMSELANDVEEERDRALAAKAASETMASALRSELDMALGRVAQLEDILTHRLMQSSPEDVIEKANARPGPRTKA